MKFNRVTDDIVSELRSILGSNNVISDDERMEVYSHDETSAEEYGHMPEVVVTPVSTAGVAEVVRLANRALVPITPRGAGSGLSGGAIPVHGGIVLSLENRMKCGIGKCGRCNVGPKYVCVDGPVFTFAELEKLPAEY